MTSVIAAPETGSTAKGQRAGSRAVRVCLSLRGVPIWVIGRLLVGCATGRTHGLQSTRQQTRSTRPTQELVACPSFQKTQWAPIRRTIPRTRPPLAAISTSPAHNLQLCPGHCFTEPRKPQARKHLVQLAPSRVAQTPLLHQNSPRQQTCTER